MARKGLYYNINKQQKSGTSRSKSNSTVSDKAYANMKAGFPKKTGGFKRYAVGGLNTSPMYGDNTISQDSTASLVYQQSNPAYQAELADQLTAVQEDTSYQDSAVSEINRQNQIEGYGVRGANMGLNKITDNIAERGLERGIEAPNSGESVQGMFKTGKEAFNQTRLANKVFQGTANANQIAKASADTGQLLGNLSNYGNTAAKTGTAVGSGLKAFAGSAGPAAVGQIVKGVGDKMMEKNDDGDASTVDKGAGVSSLGTGIGVGVGAGMLGTMAGIGAANIWNPLGWATLAATGIGAGVSYLSKRRKAKKAGDAMDVAEMSRDADANSIKRQQRFEGLKNKQYSGFDYGGDNKGPGFYKRGGVRMYQSDGVYDAADDTMNMPAYMQAGISDKQNDFMVSRGMVYNPETGGYAKPAANTMPADEMAAFEKRMSSDTYTAEEDAAYAEGQARAENPMNTEAGRRDIVLQSNKEMVNNPLYYAPGAIYGGALAYGTGAAANTARVGYNLLKAPIQKYGTSFLNNAKTAVTGVNQTGAAVSNIGRLTSGLRAGMAGTSLSQLPDKAYGIGEGLV